MRWGAGRLWFEPLGSQNARHPSIILPIQDNTVSMAASITNVGRLTAQLERLVDQSRASVRNIILNSSNRIGLESANTENLKMVPV
jgi:hypothetical protein